MSENNKKTHTVSQEELDRQKQFTQKVSSVISASYNEKPKACVVTYGCQQNVADSEKIKGMLELMGYDFTDNRLEAKLIIFNTCAVREHAEDRVFGNVGALKSYKRENHDVVIALCGCMMQQQHIADKIKKSFPFVDLVFGTHVVHKLPELLYRALTGKKRVFDITDTDGIIAEGIPVRRDNDAKAWLPIMYGCNNFCTYCIVPYVRGRERSRQPEVILREVQHLIQDGYKEIMLLGQNVNSYGKDLEQPISFAELLRKINAMEGEFVIRFMSSHPKDATPELLDTILSCEKVGQHLHLPVQCGSDAILSAMNRRYTVEQYLNIVDYLRERRPDFSLTSDLIVGFPNESEADFQGTLDLIQRVQYDNLYTFIYSKRSGTKAANMPDATSDAEKRQRMERLLTLQREIATKNYKRFLGRTMRVLVEGDSKRGDGWLFGKSNEAIIVEFMGDRSLIGTFVSVQITESKNWAVSGRLLDDERKEAVQK